MKNDVVALAMEMINTESISGNEEPMARFLRDYLEPRGWQVTFQEVAPGRPNVLARRNAKQPRLVFNSHIDTVPPFFPATIENGTLYGRGACDTKSLIAAQLLAAQELVEAGRDDIALLYVVGEEVDHIGMIHANELGLKPDYLIVGEPTESKLVTRQKGILKLALTCKGKAAHSGYPHTGRSALDPLLDLLEKIRKHPWPAETRLGETTVNIGVLKSGKAANIVPDHAYAEVLFRVVTHQTELLAQVRDMADERVEIQVVAANDPVELNTVAGYPTTVVSFNTDIPYFQFGGKAFLWGAGSITDAHTAGEKIEIADLEEAVHIYRRLAEQLLG
ncbi:M20/M25/M40 family metallo-hydrolase [Acanthopleuribacter pedis]|uniref:M20/M25/M40 family metallo-hydrolase n=1 Tax=Acanthopleuribacter pedis TaxID=442870 RepID=A0A8J7U6M1_9BACT|nr:M20/M25/M40 family metallo-hydrolase [Acanthopleuribacter pedis]MBO1321583.1 M20/M25/M40 family metallo-hydrolase [Acanthopleuribacter pedis]